ncbi:ABC transporter substrate-binding protein, partial [Paenibacillus sp. 598K]|uniref:ABC transporter substrate-binding protein n=1 Tax=Paenibacillus sp. 598K TaxID=1117987 RepID=UPI001623E749
MANRRILPLMAALLLLTAGCRDSASPDAPESSQTVIRYLHMGVAGDGEDSNPFVMRQLPQAVAERFPGVTLRPEMLPEDPYTKTLLVQLASGEGPDFFEWWPMRQLEELVAAGYLQDLSGMDILDRFTPEALEGFTVDGKVYGLPKGLSIMGTWYNKTL